MRTHGWPRLLPLVGAMALVSGAPAVAQESGGHPIQPAVSIASSRLASTCLALPREPAANPRLRKRLSHSCTVTEAARLGTVRDESWHFALYRHVSAYDPDPDTPPAERSAVPDTLREVELVVFSESPGSAAARALWHDWVDTDYEVLRPPKLTQRPEGDYLTVPYCLSGTGGCRTEILRVTSSGRWPLVRSHYAAAFRAELPEGWGAWKGFYPSLDSMTAAVPVYVPGDANCCPLFEARLALALSGDSLLLRDYTVATVGKPGMHRAIIPGIGFGTIGSETSEAELATSLGADQMERAAVYQAEGFCTPGNRLEGGTGAEAEIAWADTARTRVAFIRISQAPSEWRTPGEVTIGTTLAELERIRGRPIEFSGFGWDYGGGTDWDEPLPRALTITRRGSLGLRLAPDSAANRIIHERGAADPRGRELFGERTVRSDHPLLADLKASIRVDQIVQRWSEPAISRECDR